MMLPCKKVATSKRSAKFLKQAERMARSIRGGAGAKHLVADGCIIQGKKCGRLLTASVIEPNGFLYSSPFGVSSIGDQLELGVFGNSDTLSQPDSVPKELLLSDARLFEGESMVFGPRPRREVSPTYTDVSHVVDGEFIHVSKYIINSADASDSRDRPDNEYADLSGWPVSVPRWIVTLSLNTATNTVDETVLSHELIERGAPYGFSLQTAYPAIGEKKNGQAIDIESIRFLHGTQSRRHVSTTRAVLGRGNNTYGLFCLYRATRNRHTPRPALTALSPGGSNVMALVLPGTAGNGLTTFQIPRSMLPGGLSSTALISRQEWIFNADKFVGYGDEVLLEPNYAMRIRCFGRASHGGAIFVVDISRDIDRGLLIITTKVEVEPGGKVSLTPLKQFYTDVQPGQNIEDREALMPGPAFMLGDDVLSMAMTYSGGMGFYDPDLSSPYIPNRPDLGRPPPHTVVYLNGSFLTTSQGLGFDVMPRFWFQDNFSGIHASARVTESTWVVPMHGPSFDTILERDKHGDLTGAFGISPSSRGMLFTDGERFRFVELMPPGPDVFINAVSVTCAQRGRDATDKTPELATTVLYTFTSVISGESYCLVWRGAVWDTDDEPSIARIDLPISKTHAKLAIPIGPPSSKAVAVNFLYPNYLFHLGNGLGGESGNYTGDAVSLRDDAGEGKGGLA